MPETVDTSGFPRNDKFDPEVFRAEMDNAARSSGSSLRVSQDPDLETILGAAFRTSNTLGSFLANEELNVGRFSPDTSPVLDIDAVMAQLKDAGLAHHANLFTDRLTQNRFDARLADLKRTIDDRETLRASGGVLAEQAMGLVDPVNFIPIAGGAAKLGQGARAALRAGAVAGAGSSAISEGIMRATQPDRSPTEGVLNVAASTIFGSGLGITVERVLGGKLARSVLDRVDATMNDIRAGGPNIEKEVTAGAEFQKTVQPAKTVATNDIIPVVSSDVGAREFADAVDRISQPNADGTRMYEPWTPPVFDGSRQLGAVILPDGTKFRAEHSQFHDDIQSGAFGNDGGKFAERAAEVTMFGTRDGGASVSVVARKVDGGFLTQRQLSEIRKMLKDAGVDMRDVRFEMFDNGKKLHITTVTQDTPLRADALANSKPFTTLSREVPDLIRQTGVEAKPQSAGAAGLSKEEILAAEMLKSTDRIDARMLGIPMDKLLKNFGKLFKVKIPFTDVQLLGPLGDAIAQGLRNPRLEAQDARVALAREVANRLDQNPAILKHEAAGQVRVEGQTFSEVYAAIEGGHATAIKEIEHLWRKNRTSFENRADFGNRVFFAAINDGVDEGGNAAVEKAAAAYRKHVFDPVRKLLTDAGLLKGEEDILGGLTGGLSYVPWVHRADAIIKDRDAFLKAHADEFRNKLEDDYAIAAGNETVRRADAAEQLKIVDAEINTKIAEVKKKFNGDKSEPGAAIEGKINEAKLEKTRKLDEFSQAKQDAKDAASQRRADDLAGGKTKQAANQAYNAELRKIEDKYGATAEKSLTKELDAEIQKVTAERDAAIKALNDERKQKRADLISPKSPYERALLRLSTAEKRQEAADKLAHKYYAGATSGADDLAMGEEIGSLFPAVLKARKSPFLHREAAANGWAETNIFDMADIYHRSAGAFAAMSTVFKKPKMVKPEPDMQGRLKVEGQLGSVSSVQPVVNEKVPAEERFVPDVDLKWTLKQIDKAYDEKIQIVRENGGSAEAEIELRRERDQMRRNLEMLRDGALGRRQTFESASLQKAGDLAMQFNSWRLMGGSVASSLADPLNIVIAHGFSDTIKNGLIPAMQNLRAALGNLPPEAEPTVFRQLRWMGAVVEREKNATLGAIMDLHNPTMARSGAERVARNISKAFWDWSGLTAWTQFWKNVSGLTIQASIIDMAGQGWGKLSKGDRAWLTNLRIDENVLGRIKAMHDAQPEKFSAGVPFGHVETWTDKLAVDRFRYALNTEAKSQVISPTAADRLAFQHHPAGAIAGQFRSFGLGFMSRVVVRRAQLAGLDGGEQMAGFYTGMLMLAAMGVVVDAVKFGLGDLTLSGTSKRDPSRTAGALWLDKWQKTPGEALYNALDRTGVFFPLTEPSNVMQKIGLPNIQGVMSMLARDQHDLRAGSSRFMHRSVTEAIGGPTAGLIEDAARFAGFAGGGLSHAIGMNETFRPTSADFARGQRFLPFGNAVPIQQIMNTMRQHVGTAYDWPTN